MLHVNLFTSTKHIIRYVMCDLLHITTRLIHALHMTVQIFSFAQHTKKYEQSSPYSLHNVGLRADPGEEAVSPQVTSKL